MTEEVITGRDPGDENDYKEPEVDDMIWEVWFS